MSDLISRSELINLLYQIFENHSMATDKNDSLGGFGSEVFKSVKAMSIAYDIDKVVEELEIRKQNALEVEGSIKEYNVWKDAIEIVKQGGLRKDVE